MERRHGQMFVSSLLHPHTFQNFCTSHIAISNVGDLQYLCPLALMLGMEFVKCFIDVNLCTYIIYITCFLQTFLHTNAYIYSVETFVIFNKENANVEDKYFIISLTYLQENDSPTYNTE